MGRAYREFSFDDDIELMNLTYKMESKKLTNYNEDILANKTNDNYKIEDIEIPKNQL